MAKRKPLKKEATTVLVLTPVINFFLLGWYAMLGLGDLGLHVGYWQACWGTFLLGGVVSAATLRVSK